MTNDELLCSVAVAVKFNVKLLILAFHCFAFSFFMRHRRRPVIYSVPRHRLLCGEANFGGNANEGMAGCSGMDAARCRVQAATCRLPRTPRSRTRSSGNWQL